MKKKKKYEEKKKKGMKKKKASGMKKKKKFVSVYKLFDFFYYEKHKTNINKYNSYLLF